MRSTSTCSGAGVPAIWADASAGRMISPIAMGLTRRAELDWHPMARKCATGFSKVAGVTAGSKTSWASTMASFYTECEEAWYD